MDSLNKLKLNETGIIKYFELPSDVKKRLLSFGLVLNTRITPIYISPSGDPRAYRFRESIIAIRKSDSKHIFIEKI